MLHPSLRPLILASSSPRRRELLRELGEPFEVRCPDVAETLEPGTVERAVERLALRKAEAVAATVARGTVVGADTIVELDGVALGKPADAADAARMLTLLSGRVHRVHTGVAALHVGSGRRACGCATTAIRMRPISRSEVDAYVATGEPFGKAGGYAVQETGDTFVAAMEGPWDNVVGLPLGLLRALLADLAAAGPG